jgi:YD repeat-containing protein
VYDLSPGGIWQRKTSRNGSGQTPEVLAGTANRRGAYLSLGSRHFRYDANGNRVSEEGGEAGGPDRKQFSYDAANRLVGATSVGADGRVVQEVEYAYDTFGRQVMKRVSRDGVTKSYALVWHGSQLIEEWEDGELAKTFTYGARTGEPLKVSVQTGGKPEEYFYALDGRGIVTGLIDRRAALVERYRCDAFGLPFRSESAGPPAGRAARTDLGNPLLIVGAQWDHDTQLYIRLSDAFDPSTGASIRGGNPGIPTQQADFLVDMIKEQQREEEKRHNKDLENIGMALVGIGFIVVVGLGLPLLIGRFGLRRVSTRRTGRVPGLPG